MLPPIQADEETKWLKAGKPGIVLVSFTNMAVRQIAKHFSADITCCTIHKLLEYVPVTYEIDDPETGLTKKTVRFEPSRNSRNKLPRSLQTIVVDESSMVDIDLIEKVKDALPNPDAVQWIFLGDLNQLPPVYGGPILGRALLTLPIVELTRVYRQALESPIISLALDIKDGKSPLVPDGGYEIDKGDSGKLVVKPWSKPIHEDDALNKAANFCKGAIAAGIFDPFKDMILIPFNKSFGTIELNKSIADWLGRERNVEVVEVIAGFNTHYLAKGDKVLVQKREAIITGIAVNRGYSGKRPVDPRLYKLDRWGGATKIKGASVTWEQSNENMDVDAILESMSATHTEIEDRKHQASHILTVRFINGTDPSKWTDQDSELTDETFETTLLETAAQINDMLGGYAVTVHKSQGSEWRKVFIFLHQKHSQMCSRELVYTAVTRAAKELYIICEPDRGIKPGSLLKAAKTPRLKGNTLAEKLLSLKEKFDQDAKESINQRKEEE